MAKKSYDLAVIDFTHPTTGNEESVNVYRPQAKALLGWALGSPLLDDDEGVSDPVAFAIMFSKAMEIDANHWAAQSIVDAIQGNQKQGAQDAGKRRTETLTKVAGKLRKKSKKTKTPARRKTASEKKAEALRMRAEQAAAEGAPF
jgi:hypothetical protein